MAMKKSEVLETAKKNVVALLGEVLESASAEQVDFYKFAIPTEVDGNERWVEISLTAKDTMTDTNGDKVPYDPFVAKAVWDEVIADRNERKAERDRKHAEAVKRAEDRKAKAKAKAEAKKTATAESKTE